MNNLKTALANKSFALIGQLRLHQDLNEAEVIEQAQTLAKVVDGVAVTDCPYGVLHMSGLCVAALLINHGIDPVVHLAARDRNRIALKSDMLGAAALGVTTFLLQRGDPLPDELQPTAKQVFDTGAKKLLALGSQLSDFRVSSGHESLFLGTIATVFDPQANWRPAELAKKVSAGAQFIQTQVCLDAELLRRWVASLVAARLTWQCQVIVSVPLLTSAQQARWLYENLRSPVMPESVVRGFEAAEDPVRHGINLCADFLNILKSIPGVAGANLSTTGDAEHIVAAVTQAAL